MPSKDSVQILYVGEKPLKICQHNGAFVVYDPQWTCPLCNVESLERGIHKELRDARAALKGMLNYGKGEAVREEGERKTFESPKS